jgi:putative DNA-invertase from lambdoid prophage Rac
VFRSAVKVPQQLQRQGVSLHLIDPAAISPATVSRSWFFAIVSAIAEAERERVCEIKRDQAGRDSYLGGNILFG